MILYALFESVIRNFEKLTLNKLWSFKVIVSCLLYMIIGTSLFISFFGKIWKVRTKTSCKATRILNVWSLGCKKAYKASRTPNAISLECEKVGELASKFMRTQNGRSVRVAAIKFIINAYYYRENYILFANRHIIYHFCIIMIILVLIILQELYKL